MLGYKSKSSGSSYGSSIKTQRQEKQTGSQAASEGAKRISSFGSAVGKSGGDAVSRIQSYGKAEAERQRKKKADDEAAAKKKPTAAPAKGFFQRMMDKHVYGKKEE